MTTTTTKNVMDTAAAAGVVFVVVVPPNPVFEYVADRQDHPEAAVEVARSVCGHLPCRMMMLLLLLLLLLLLEVQQASIQILLLSQLLHSCLENHISWDNYCSNLM